MALQDVETDARVPHNVAPSAVVETENIRVNAGMVRNVLDAVSDSKTVHHVALVTGLKHYLGPFEAYGKGILPDTPFREEQPRLDIQNFYYAQEDKVFSAAARRRIRMDCPPACSTQSLVMRSAMP